MEIKQNVSKVMRALKKESRKSMTEFSDELQISRSALQDYLSGKGNPSVNTLEHLAQRLGVNTSFLVSGAFSEDQLGILFELLGTFEMLSKLTPEGRLRFARLLLEMVTLWNGEDGREEADRGEAGRE